MGIGFTNLDPTEIVSLSDSALLDVDSLVIRKYEMTRRLSDLPDSIWLRDDPPVVFKIKPLSVQWESVALAMDSSSVRAIVREHVMDIRRGKNAKHPGFHWKDGKLTEDSVNQLPLAICSELGAFIVQSQDRVPGGTIPFSPTSQPGWSQVRENSKRLARLAQLATAIETIPAESKEVDLK